VQSEVAFLPLYNEQPNFADQDRALQTLGFQFFGMQTVNRFPMRGVPTSMRRQSRRNDIGPCIDGDALYLRQFRTWQSLPSTDIRRMIVLLSGICSALSATIYLARILVERGDLATEVLDQLFT
jgi:hypothetical protein